MDWVTEMEREREGKVEKWLDKMTGMVGRSGKEVNICLGESHGTK